MVDLDAVIARAKKLGRSISPLSTEVATESELESASPLMGEARDPEPSGEQQSGTPPGTMIVPIDAWNKMLNQLGNLHEAGQQLAEAKERAAKAETEAKFLRQQLAENRTRNTEDEPQDPKPEPEPEPVSGETTTYWRHLTIGWRNRKKRR